VLAIVCLALVVSALAWSADLTGHHVPPLPPRLPWWLLVPLFAAVEVVVVQVHTTRETRSVSLSEFPLVLGLFLARPTDLMLGAVIGPALAYTLYHRQRPVKAAFNTTLRVFGTTAALAVFHALSGPLSGPPPLPVQAWLAALAAALSTNALESALVMAVVALHDRTVGAAALVRDLATLSMTAAVVACGGLLAMSALHADPRTGALLLVLGSAGLAAYHVHATVRERQARLERLQAFSRTLDAAGQSEQVIRSVLAGGDGEGCCCSTSTSSPRSTPHSVIRLVMCCCAGSPSGWPTGSRRAPGSPGSAATSSPSCCRV
jgi:hypothetical protein